MENILSIVLIEIINLFFLIPMYLYIKNRKKESLSQSSIIIDNIVGGLLFLMYILLSGVFWYSYFQELNDYILTLFIFITIIVLFIIITGIGYIQKRKKFNIDNIISELLNNDDFLLISFSKVDNKIITSLKENGDYTDGITISEVIIFKWFLIRQLVGKLLNNGINTDLCEKIILIIDEKVPRIFQVELNHLTNKQIENRFFFYLDKLENLNHVSLSEIGGLLKYGKLNSGLLYNPISIILIQEYLLKQLKNSSNMYPHIYKMINKL